MRVSERPVCRLPELLPAAQHPEIHARRNPRSTAAGVIRLRTVLSKTIKPGFRERSVLPLKKYMSRSLRHRLRLDPQFLLLLSDSQSQRLSTDSTWKTNTRRIIIPRYVDSFFNKLIFPKSCSCAKTLHVSRGVGHNPQVRIELPLKPAAGS